jgi:hypothetical protein
LREFPVHVGNRWVPLAALAATAVTAICITKVTKAWRRHARAQRDIESARQISSWENEGGHPAPAPASLARVGEAVPSAMTAQPRRIRPSIGLQMQNVNHKETTCQSS